MTKLKKKMTRGKTLYLRAITLVVHCIFGLAIKCWKFQFKLCLWNMGASF